MINAYPSAGSLPVAFEGPAVGAGAAMPVAVAKYVNANPKSKINAMAERSNTRMCGVLTEWRLPVINRLGKTTIVQHDVARGGYLWRFLRIN
jgi:hypothetical protein